MNYFIILVLYYKYITIHKNLYYIYFDEDSNKNIQLLNNYLTKNILKFLFIRNNITNKFIISNNYNKNDIKYINNSIDIFKNNTKMIQNNNTIYININKIKYIKNNNIPIINILG